MVLNRNHYMKTIIGPLLVLLILGRGGDVFAQEKNDLNSAGDKMGYLNNGVIKVGVDLDLGGSITYLAASGGENMINNFDWGRQLQMSFYSGPVPFFLHDKKPLKAWEGLGWNPIQSGDCFGNRTKVIVYKNNGKEIYLKSIPMQWPLDRVPGECTFESWISLAGNAV